MPQLHLDTGNTGFMLLCSSLVMLMTPGLAFFYGGLVGRKNVLAIMMQSFASMGWTTVLWWAFGFSMCFSGDLKSGTDFAGIIGNFDLAFLRGVTLNTPSPANDTIPLIVFFGYQMMFAIITPALITGAFANRVRFPAYMLFLTAWLVLVYFPFVHMIWGGGIMAKWGVLDFAGGIVVHNIAGIAALASVLYVGRRKVADRGPHSIPLVALGTGLLWFGWYGFNAGSEFRVDSVTAVAFVNTDLAASFAGIAWLAMDWMTTKKPKFLGLLTGAVAGLATITPAAGLRLADGRRRDRHPRRHRLLLRGGAQEQAALGRRTRRVGRPRRRRLPRHRLLRRVRHARRSIPPASNGLLHGNPHFFLVQLGAVCISSVWAFVFTYGMLWIIDRVTPVKVDEAGQTAGPRPGAARRDRLHRGGLNPD